MSLGIGGRRPSTRSPTNCSSWLHRLAIANGVAPRAFAGVLGLCGRMWSPRLDLRLPKDLAAWLGARTGVAPEAISAMAMSDGELAPLWLPLRETTRRSRSTWLQYCALCLADDRASGGPGDSPRGFRASGIAAACETDVPPAAAGCFFMALLSFRGISTPSLTAQGEQRRSALFNIPRDNPLGPVTLISKLLARAFSYRPSPNFESHLCS